MVASREGLELGHDRTRRRVRRASPASTAPARAVGRSERAQSDDVAVLRRQPRQTASRSCRCRRFRGVSQGLGPWLTHQSIEYPSRPKPTLEAREQACGTEPGARWSSSRRRARRSGAAIPRRATTRTPTPTSCSAKTYTEVIERAGIEPSEVEDVITGCVQQYGEQAFNVGRNAWLQAGLPVETPGHDRRPPVRLGPAGRELRRRARRVRRARRRHRLAASSTWATSRWASASSGPSAGRLRRGRPS